MRITKICVIGILGLSILSGCGAPSTSKEVSVKSTSTESQPLIVKAKASSIALVTDITREMVPEKPGVTRIVMTLDRKASYAVVSCLYETSKQARNSSS